VESKRIVVGGHNPPFHFKTRGRRETGQQIALPIPNSPGLRHGARLHQLANLMHHQDAATRAAGQLCVRFVRSHFRTGTSSILKRNTSAPEAEPV